MVGGACCPGVAPDGRTDPAGSSPEGGAVLPSVRSDVSVPGTSEITEYTPYINQVYYSRISFERPIFLVVNGGDRTIAKTLH